MKRLFFAVLAVLVACSSPQGGPSDMPNAQPPAAPPPTIIEDAGQPDASKHSPAYEAARKAAGENDWAKVRELLGPAVMSGRGAREEVRIVSDACKVMHDYACIDQIKKLYPKKHRDE